jgi:molybdate transport system permease protein
MDSVVTADELESLLLSARVAAWCVAVSVVPAVAVAWLLARRQFPGKTLLDAIVHLPLVLPPVLVGYVLLLLLGRGSPLGRWLEDAIGLPIAFTWRAAVLASAVVGFPLLVRSARLAMELADRRLEEAARTLGAGPLAAFATVTLPLAAPGILTGMILCFGRSLGEFGATITFAGNIEGETRTLPLALFTYANVPGGDAAALRLVVISVLLSLAALVASELLMRRMRRRAA